MMQAVREGIDELRNSEDITPGQLKILIGITFGAIAIFGIVSYLVVFVYWGY